MDIDKKIQCRWTEDSSAQLMARIANRSTDPDDAEGTAFVQADFSSITLSVYQVSAAGVPTLVAGFEDTPLTIASVIFNTLQDWDIDDTGANFLYTLGPLAFPTGSLVYDVEVKWTLADGRIGHTVWTGWCRPIHGS